MDEIHNIQKKYAAAALRCAMAGADVVEWHNAHNYLGEQFFSPYFNHRTDEYGQQSVENSMRFAREALTLTRRTLDAAGYSHVELIAKLNGSEIINDDITPELLAASAKELEKAGIALITVNGGGGLTRLEGMSGDGHRPEGWKVKYAEIVKNAVSIPVAASGNLKHPSYVDAIIREGKCDLVALGRTSICDPHWVNKCKAGREDLIRKCLGCMNCNKSVVAGKNLHCAINPVTGRATVYGDENLVKTGAGRTVAVVGGGPGGMQAALLLKKRGYYPVIFESRDHLGGSAVLASKAPCKGMVAELIETMKAEMKEYHIEVRLNTPATVETLRALDPYGVVVACGGDQIVPNIPGVDRSNVYYIEDVLLRRVSFEGKNIAVIGGGHVGLEVAHFLCDNNKVTVVEMQKEVGVTIYRTARYKLLSLLAESGVEVLTEHAIAGVTDGAVELKKTDTGEVVTRPADIVIMALGNRPDKSYEQQLKDAFDKVVFVGDANKGGTMADATLSAYENCWFF